MIKELDKPYRPVIFIFAFIVSFLSFLTPFDFLHRYIELLSHFRFHYFSLSIFLCLILFLIKHNKMGAIMIIPILFNGAYIAPWYLSQPENRNLETSSKFKIIHSNVYSKNTNYDDFLKLIKKENPDIIVLQEFTHSWHQNTVELNPRYKYRILQPQEDNFGIALFSKYPLSNHKITRWGSVNLPSIESEILIGDQIVTLLTTHPYPPISDYSYKARNNQLNELSKRAAQISTPSVLVGDLNVTMWSSDYKKIETVTNYKNARKGFGVIPTWPSFTSFMAIPIDHVLTSPHFEVIDIRAGSSIDSDHLPLIVELELKV